MATFQVRSLCHVISASENPHNLKQKQLKAITKVTQRATQNTVLQCFILLLVR